MTMRWLRASSLIEPDRSMTLLRRCCGRVCIVPGPGACVMLVVFDHLVGDGWSLWQLIEELRQALLTETTHSKSPNETRPAEFFAHIAEQRRGLESPPGRRQFEYWKQVLAQPYPMLNLLPDYHKEEARDTVSVVLNEALTSALRALSAKHAFRCS